MRFCKKRQDLKAHKKFVEVGFGYTPPLLTVKRKRVQKKVLVRVFFFCLFFSVLKTDASPWRPKNVFRVTTSLPSRLIDSIMAQGNWNILFQESPFAEFQRQIAIANFFALRDDVRQADYYFEKARTTLEIIYASLRGNYNWPKNSNEITSTQNLPWGESRDTFEDYLLCRLQLKLEILFTGKKDGKDALQELEAHVSKIESQLSKPIVDKDASMASFVNFFGEGLKLRQKTLRGYHKAEQFAKLSDAQKNLLSDYWERRTIAFRILENIRYGNLGRALFLVRLVENNRKEKLDGLALARLYIRCGAFGDAKRVLEESLSKTEIKAAENFGDYLSHSQVLENIEAWLSSWKNAEEQATQAANHLQNLLNQSNTPREIFVDLRKAAYTERLRSFVFAYIGSGKCPSSADFVFDTDMEREWLLREAIFFERCNVPVGKNEWAHIKKGMDADEKLLFAYHRKENLPRVKANEVNLSVYIRARDNLQKALRVKDTKKLVKLLTDALDAKSKIDFAFAALDWGIWFSSDIEHDALKNLPSKINKGDAWRLFVALNRKYAQQIFKDAPWVFFSPEDAAYFSQNVTTSILDLPEAKISLKSEYTTDKNLYFTDSQISLAFESKGNTGILTLGEPYHVVNKIRTKETVFFGDVLGINDGTPQDAASFVPPLFFRCGECAAPSGANASRLVAPRVDSATRKIIAELSDNFSTTWNFSVESDCPQGGVNYEDSLFLTVNSNAAFPCNLNARKIIIEKNERVSAIQKAALLAMGFYPNSMLITYRVNISDSITIPFLYDFFQRVNRRQITSTEAFFEAKKRAEKSFSGEGHFLPLRNYETFH
ncbi:MAG: hypothetical protein LDLANPLL_01525 [Turneriella sp.]|nr:hypothetical protein [Turneriella sp.]